MLIVARYRQKLNYGLTGCRVVQDVAKPIISQVTTQASLRSNFTVTCSHSQHWKPRKCDLPRGVF